MIETEKAEKNKLPIMENRQRLDLTEWVIHFVHDRKPLDNPTCVTMNLKRTLMVILVINNY